MSSFPPLAVVARVRAFGWDSLVRNGMMMLITAATNLGAGFAFLFVASRYWSAHDLGISASVTSAIMLAATLADIGLGTTLIQELARQTGDRAWSRVLNSFLLVGVALSLVAAVATILILRVAVPATTELIDSPGGVGVVVIGVVFTMVGGYLGAACIAQRRADMSLILTAAFQALRLIILLAFAHLVSGPLGIAGSGTLAMCVTVPFLYLVAISLVRRGYSRRERPDLRLIHAARGTFGGHYLINLTGAVPLVVMPLMIVSRMSPTNAAYYYAAWALAGALCAIAGSVAGSLFVEGSHQAEDLPRLLRRSAVVTYGLLLPAMVIAAALGHTALGLFGEQYALHGTGLFYILLVSAIPQAATTIYVASLRVEGRLRRAAALYVGTGCIAIALAWALLPSMGVEATGVAWLVSQCFGAAVAGSAWIRRRGQREAAGPVPLESDPGWQTSTLASSEEV